MIGTYRKLDTPLYVEEIVIKVPPERVDEWIALDEKIWGPLLARQPWCVGKEIWVSRDVPGEIVSIIYWSDYDAWKNNDQSWVDEVDRQMMEGMGGTIESMTFHDLTNQRIKVGEYI